MYILLFIKFSSFYLGNNQPKWKHSLSIIKLENALSKSMLLVTLQKIPEEYQMKFDVMVTSFGQEVLLFKVSNKNIIFRLGFRQDGLLIITTYKNNEVLLKSKDVFEENKPITFEIRQVKQETNYTFSVYLNGSNVYEVSYDQVEEYADVSIYTGGQGSSSFGLIKNMLISGISIFLNASCISCLPVWHTHACTHLHA